MNKGYKEADPDQPIVYQIRIKGHLGPRWTDWFEGLTVTPKEGDTLLTGLVVDQAALHGLLRKVRDLGLPLISVTRIKPGPTEVLDVGQGTETRYSSRRENEAG